MAAVLDAMIPYVKKLITDMAEEEVSMLLGVSDEITRLEDNMEGIKAFLADAERRRITDQSVQRWVRKLKDAMYDATDIIDLCELEADKRRGSTEDGSSVKKKVSAGCFQPLLFCMRNPVFAHKMGSRIKELNQRLDGIHKEADRFKFSINLGSNPEPRKLTDAERSTQNMTSEFDESAIVGEKIEQDTRELAQLLITGGLHDIKVVSIVGTGGMGKTTLAQKIFNEVTIQEQFEVKVWLSITQHFDEIELLKTAIEHAGGVHGGTQDKTLLTRTLTDTLSTGRRFLLVLDDVWSNQAWSHVLSVPVKNASQKQQGNWVLITTRSEDLAQRMGASFYQHRVSPLNEEDAWSLLTKQLPPSPNQVTGIDYLRDVGMKIVRKCDGLPLAVKVMGGLLSTKSRSEREWEAVLDHHAWSVVGLPKELDSRIYLSYEDLSSQQKQCFLYCSLFPKGTFIRWRHVIPMWISEGFIQPHTDRSSSDDDQLEEIAIEYYKELITRNLIEAQRPLTPYRCTMHDVVRSFAGFMAREESLVVQDMQVASGSNDSLVRRLSIGPTSLVSGLAALQKQSVRTLFINSKLDFELSGSLNSFSMLRVLSIKGGDCDRLVGSLCQLRHLRYLGLEGTNISRLPDNINNMKFLQHIVLPGSIHLENLPRTIIQLVHLRTLDIFGSNDNVVIPKEFGGLRNLRTLCGFRVHMDMDGGWCSLEEIGPLSMLRRLTLHGLEDVSASSLAETARISSKEHLEYMELEWTCSGFMELRDEIKKQQQQEVVEEVLEKLCPPPRIHDLIIKGYFGRTLPNWMMVVEACAFKSLSLLNLKDLPCCTKLPDGLCQLPSLKGLGIADAPAIKSVGSEFQASSSSSTVGRGVIASTSAAFPNLTRLSLVGLCEWEEWDWEEQTVDVTAGTMAMHALEYLVIKDCKLSCLPPGLANNKRHALRDLYLYGLSNLASVENFPSVVELDVFDCPKLKRISGLSKLHKIRIVRCPELEVFQGVPVLDIIVLEDATMETLPGYLACVNPRFLKLGCSKELHDSIISGSSSECEKISHITKLDINCIEEGFR
ncbi:hypothetical protein SETIT_8G249300v2 [Setaria italica]|uniref:AAA+ ATPase domain-containing protein n=1 Tax=Setaria italica TaxID=4555 RepID=K3ZH10_SETIT|nr:putative disease resistance protein RGA3 [Setaria italica]XP_022685099.1 putative disease resistance protein RGA3 [Setaria italica]RCV39769.1 hypothetical protein SETIT_8G249300v2 [Setaria italica]